MSQRVGRKIGIIGLKIALLTSLVAASVAILVGMYVYDAAIDELIKHEKVDLREETKLRGYEVLTRIATLRTDVLSLTAAPSLEELVRTRRAPRNEQGDYVDPRMQETDHRLREELAAVFRAVCLNRPTTPTDPSSPTPDDDARETGPDGDHDPNPYYEVRLIEFSDTARELVRVRRSGSTSAPAITEDLTARDADDPFILRLRDRIQEGDVPEPHEVALSEFVVIPESTADTGQIRPRPALMAAVVVRDPANGAFGAVVINLDLGEICESFLLSARHLAFLTDEQGDFLFHPDPRFDEDLTLADEESLWRELGRFYSDDIPRDVQLTAQEGYNLGDPDGKHVLELGEYRFRLIRFQLTGSWNDEEWKHLTEDQLTPIYEEYRDRVAVGNPERMIKGSTGVMSISAPLNDQVALAALREVETKLNSIPGIEPQYTEECRSFYASFVRLNYDPQDSRRFLGLTMAFSQDEMYADLLETRKNAMLGGVAFVVLAVLAAFGFSYMLTRRLTQMTSAADSIAAGEFEVELPTGHKDEIGDLARGFQHMIREVQAREQKIEEREVRLRMIVDGAAEGIITIDTAGGIRSVNSAASRMFGYTTHSLSGGNVRELLAPGAWEEFDFTLKRLLVDGASSGEIPTLGDDSSTFRQLLKNRGAKTESLFLETVGRRPDGEQFPIELSLSTVRLPDQRVVTVITRDITQRKQNEEQIQQLNEELERRNEDLEQGVRERTAELEQAMLELREARDKAQELARAKDAFLASVSHELRNPLNQVSGFCQLLELSELDGEQQRDVRKIRIANDQLLALINDILDYQKIIMGGLTLEPEPLDVETLVCEVRDATSVLANPNRNQFYVEWSDDVGSVYADKQRLRQVLLNLVGNAWKFTREGSVHLSASRQHGETGDWIEFSVRDTGRGMTPQEQARLFRPFTKLASRQGNESGTGLGLVISRGLCTLMRGDITLQSEFGKGSCFTVRLPATRDDRIDDLAEHDEVAESIARSIDEPGELQVSEDAPATESPAGDVRAAGDRGRLVLVIDDDPGVCEMMQRHLRSHGFDVATAGSGLEGLELARKLKPAVITLDAIMPGLDGWAVLGALKAGDETQSIPVIMVTVMDREDRGRALGATEFLPKPIDWERLTETLSRYTGDKRDRSILVVDDDTNTREIIRRSLESDGWAVIEAENGRQALERLAAERPAAVLLDLMMPIMDGFEFIVNYSQVAEWLSIPVLVLTAKDPTPEERSRLEGQVVRVLRKGDYTHEELLGEIHRRVDRHLKHQLAGGGDGDGEDPGR